MLLKKTIATFIIFTFFSPLNAFWQIAAWQKLRQEATKLAGRVLTSLYSPNVNSQETRNLGNQVSSLENELKQYDEIDNRPQDFLETKNLILSLKTVINNLDQRVTSLEKRVNLLEKRLSLTKLNSPVIEKVVNKKYTQKILRKIKPSFKCYKAKRPIEHAICANLILRDIDGRMGRIYWKLRKQTYGNKLKKEQLKWLKKRDRNCNSNDTECLISIYEDRISELQQNF